MFNHLTQLDKRKEIFVRQITETLRPFGDKIGYGVEKGFHDKYTKHDTPCQTCIIF